MDYQKQPLMEGLFRAMIIRNNHWWKEITCTPNVDIWNIVILNILTIPFPTVYNVADLDQVIIEYFTEPNGKKLQWPSHVLKQHNMPLNSPTLLQIGGENGEKQILFFHRCYAINVYSSWNMVKRAANNANS